MSVIYIEKVNESYIRIKASDSGIEQEISEYFCFEVPGAKYMKAYKARLWDGKIRLYNLKTNLLYAGLYDKVLKFAFDNKYGVKCLNEIEHKQDCNLEEIDSWIQSLHLSTNKIDIAPKYYQKEAFIEAIQNYRRTLVSPTASGKSLIIYLICRWLFEQNEKILIVVPTVDLVKQLYGDFMDYSYKNDWVTSDHTQMIFGGQSKDITKHITISTWQSIYNDPPEFFKQFTAVISDECHLASAKSLTTILEQSTNAKYRIGTTGTLSKSKTNELVLNGILGNTYKVISTRELIDAGNISDLKIKCLQIHYPDDVKKIVSKWDYDKEYDYIIQNQSRRNMVCNLALSLNGNTLILMELVEKQAKPILALLQSKNSGRNIYAAFGSNSIEEVKSIIAQDTNAIIVASYKKLSTGTNIPSIENIIFGSPSKSFIRVIQSIGRGLRLNQGKSHCTLYDLIDDISWKSKKNTTLKHGIERINIYNEEKFQYQVYDYHIKT